MSNKPEWLQQSDAFLRTNFPDQVNGLRNLIESNGRRVKNDPAYRFVKDGVEAFGRANRGIIPGLAQQQPPQGRSSALPSLRRGDDIPAAQYPEGVSTGVGGGNAGQAQSQDPNAPAYIAPSKPPEVTTPGRDAAPPRGGDDRGAKGTQMSSSARMDVLYKRLSSPQGDGGFGVPFNFEGNAPTLPGNNNQQQTNTQYATQDGDFKADYSGSLVTPHLKGYAGDPSAFATQMEYVRNHGYATGEAFGHEGANPQASNSPLPDKASSQTEISFPGAEEAQSEFNSFYKEDQKPKPRRRPRGERAGEMFDRQRGGGFEEDTYESKTTGRPRSNRSFLDGDRGSMMALRALEASQGTMKQNGVTYGRDATGKWVQLTDEAAKALKNDRSSVATVDFVGDNQFKPQQTSVAEQGDVEVPSISADPVPYDAATASTPVSRIDRATTLEPAASIQTQDIPYEVKEPQLFLSKKLQENGLN